MDSHTPPAIIPLWHMLIGHGLEWLDEQRASASMLDATQMVFRLGNEHFCIPVTHVRGIHPLGFYTPIPLVDACIIGKIAPYGKPVGVLDIRPLIGQARTPPQPDAAVIIIELHNMELGLLADLVMKAHEHQRLHNHRKNKNPLSE